MSAFTLIRAVVFGVGGLLVLLGFSGMVAEPALAPAGLMLVGMGGFMLVVSVLERQRYRSEAAEATNEPVGPGGGETAGPVEPRFRPTAEVFLDPTTGRRMRVLVDPATGERRYVAEA